MSYEYYNADSSQYMRGRPDPPDLNGCLWQLAAFVLLVLLLAILY